MHKETLRTTMSVFSYTVQSKGHGVFCKAASRLQKCLVLILLLLTGSSLSAQVIETLNETGGTAGDPGLKIEILADGTQRIYKGGMSQTYEGTNDPRGLTTYIGLNNTFVDSTRRVNKVTWDFVSPKRGEGTVMSPWRIQLIGNVLNYNSTIYGGTVKITVICDITYIKDQPYYIMDYTVASISDLLTTKGHLYLAEHAALDVTAGDWSGNALCSKGYGPGTSPFTTLGLYRDDACGSYNVNRAHVLRLKKGFTSYMATDAAGMVVNIPENCWLSNIYNATYDGTENGMIAHLELGNVYGGSATSSTTPTKAYSARILSGYGNTVTDFDGITNIDSIPPATNRQLGVEFQSASASGLEDNIRHSAYNLNIRVFSRSSTAIVVNSPLYVPVRATPSGGNPATAGVDYECKRGILIPAGTYTSGGSMVAVDSSIMILGNTLLQNSPRQVTFTLDNSINNNLVYVNTTKNLCAYQILDDEARTLTFSLPTEMDEGQTANATISLPSGVVASSDITVTLTRRSSSTTNASGDITFPSSVVIRQNTNSATFTIQAQSDKILENQETLDLQADADVLGVPQSSSSSIAVKDRTYDDPANRVITMRPVPGVTVGEPYTGGLQFSLPAGVTTEIPVYISLGALHNDPASTASTADYTLDSTDFQITTGNAVTIPFTAIDDNLAEGTERLHVTATVSDNIPRAYDFTAYDILILDDDANALKITASATDMTEGGASVTFTVSLPAGTLASADIPLSITGTGTSVATDYSALPDANFKIPVGGNSATFTLSAFTDNQVEGDETLILSGGSADYNITPFTTTIKDATNTAANLQLKLTIIGGNIKEGNSAALKVGFVNSVVAGKPIAVAIARNAASQATASDLGFTSGSTITIPAGQQEVTVNGFVTAQTDQILERTEGFILDGSSSDITGLTVESAIDSILDATGDNPANKVITIATQAAPMNEGTAYNVTFSLPAGITTDVPIDITPWTGVGSTAVDADYVFDPIPSLNSTNSSVTGTLRITSDGILEPDETLVINASGVGIPGITFTPTSVTLKDEDFVAGMALRVTADTTSITEGGSKGAMVTVSLPAGKITSYNIPITIAKNASSIAGDAEHTALPATVTITVGSGSVTFPQALLANTDNLLEDDETLVIDASTTGMTTGSLTLTIKDGSNPRITVQPQPFSAGTTVLEGNNYTVRVALPAGITPYKPFNVTLAAGTASTAAATDYTGLPATVTINPGENFKDITLAAATDNIIENAELLRLKGTVTGFTGITVDSLNVTIDDLTRRDPTNLQLRVMVDSTTLHEGNSSGMIIGFVKPSITSSTNVTVNFTPDPAYTGAAADYTGLTASVVLPAGSNQVTRTMNMVNDNLVEGTEILKLNTTVTAGYTIIAPANITIPEAQLQITATKTADAAEPSTNGGFSISLPGTLLAGADINVTSIIGGTAGSADWNVTGQNVVIKAGTNSVTIPVTVKDDKLVEGGETVTLALQRASMPRGSSTVTFLVNTAVLTVNLTDDDANNAGRNMMVEKITNAREPATPGTFRIRFSDASLTVVRDVQVSYAVSGTATPGTDYTPVSGTLTIPAGQNGTSVSLAPLDDNMVEDTEMVNIEITDVTSTMTGITWPLVANPRTSVPIVDNDSMNLSLFAQPAAITEGDTIQVTLKSAATNKVDVPVSLKVVHDPARTITTSVGTINGNGDTLTVTMPAGLTEYTFSVVSADNQTNDDDGFVFLQVLPDPSSAVKPLYRPGLAADINVIVGEDDSLMISFREDKYTVNEGHRAGENMMTIEVQLSRAASRPISLPYKFGDMNGSVSFLGAAVPGADFDSVMKPIEIQPGELSTLITVSIFGDSTFERNDTLSIVLLPPVVSSGQNAPVAAAPDSVLGIIMNDDPFCPICDTDGDGVLDGREETNNNGDPLDDDADSDGIPNYLDDDSDNDGVPDSVEGWITDGRWVNNNSGKIRVHPAISPNADGIGNDAMYVENIEKYERNEVLIFNRWGATVYQTSNYNNQDNNFKGLNSSGKEVTDGSYFYRILVWDSAGKQEQYVGFIVVKRK